MSLNWTKLFNEQADNGNSNVLIVNETYAGNMMLYAKATSDWDSGSLVVQVSPDAGTTWFTARIPGGITAVTPLTTDGFIYFSAPSNSHIRLNLSSVSGAAADISAWVTKVVT